MTKDLTEKTFGLLTAKKIVGKSKQGTLWYCECACRGDKVVPASYLTNHHARSCGCIATAHITNLRKEDITCESFGGSPLSVLPANGMITDCSMGV